jgi:hypothetical protein
MSKLDDLLQNVWEPELLDSCGLKYREIYEPAKQQIKYLMLELIGEDIPGKAGNLAFSGADELAQKSWETGRKNGINTAKRELRKKVQAL